MVEVEVKTIEGLTSWRGERMEEREERGERSVVGVEDGMARF
jgi:hypothetical protein